MTRLLDQLRREAGDVRLMGNLAGWECEVFDGHIMAAVVHVRAVTPEEAVGVAWAEWTRYRQRRAA